MVKPRAVLVVCSLGLLLVGLDATIVTVALPDMRRSLGASVAGLQWIVDAYTLVLAGLLMLAGSTADRLGRRRVFEAGLVVFAGASLLCALAPSLPLLLAARVLQAVGAAMLSPVGMSIVRTVYDDPAERARAIGIFASMFGVSMALGPILGGALVSATSWRAVFVVGIPIALVALVLCRRHVPESRAPTPRRPDPVGQALLIVGLAGLTAGVIDGGRAGWTAPEALIPLLVAAAALAWFAVHGLRHPEPLLDPRVFRSASLTGAVAIAVCLTAALGGFLFMTTLYLQSQRGLSPVQAGLALVPVAAALIVGAPRSGRLVAAGGTRRPLVLGGATVAVAGVLLSGLSASTPLPVLLVAFAVFGVGFALVSPPIATTAVAGLPAAQAGTAAAVATTGRQLGITLGVAGFGALLHGVPDAGLADATHAGWWAVAALGAVVAVVGAATATGHPLSPGRAARGTRPRRTHAPAGPR